MTLEGWGLMYVRSGDRPARQSCQVRSIPQTTAQVFVFRTQPQVVNEGASGGSVKFDGDAAQPAGDGDLVAKLHAPA